MSIYVKGLRKRFNGFVAVDDVSFAVQDGEFVSLLGPSGSGKSTVLRCIAGLEVPNTGYIEIDGEDVTHIPVQERKVGFVFQHYAIFKHMTVLENIAFGLKVRGSKASYRDKKARDLLDLVGLSGYEKRMPSQLSGGQRQRVALARALAPEPKLLLLDEPFGALDARLRKGLRSWLRKLHDQIKLTTLMVTHDQEEAFELSDKVLVVNKGKIEQEAEPKKIFNEPATEFVARFVGETNRVQGTVHKDKVKWGPFSFRTSDSVKNQTQASVLFRPIDVYISSKPEGDQVAGQILSTKFMGAFEELIIEFSGGHQVVAHVPKGVALQSEFHAGKNVFVSITSAYVFPIEAEETSVFDYVI